MTIYGVPPAMAILDRRNVGAGFELVERGIPVVCGIEFGTDHLNPRFKNLRGNGAFMCLLFTETKFAPISIEVSEPAAFATSHNKKSFKQLEWDQIQTCTFTLGDPMTMNVTKLERKLIQNSHLTFSWMVELEEEEECVLAVDGEPDRSWTLLVMRMMPDGITSEWFEHPNIVRNFAPSSVSGSTLTSLHAISTLDVHDGNLERKYRLTNNTNPNLNITWCSFNPTGRSQFDHRILLRVRRSSIQAVPAGGNADFVVRRGVTIIHTETFSVPTDDGVVELEYIAVGGIGGLHDVRFMGITPGMAMEVTYRVEPVLP